MYAREFTNGTRYISNDPLFMRTYISTHPYRTTTTAVWGATGFIILVYATDWEQIIRFVPYVKNKIPPKVEEE